MTTLKDKRERFIFGCSQEDFFGVTELGCESYQLYQPQLFGYSEKYTPTWGIDLLNQMIAARDLPDFFTRLADVKSLRIELVDLTKNCCIKAKDLEAHIYNAFPEEQHEAMWQKAGGDHYYDASKEDWEAVTSLMDAGIKFIALKLTELTTGGMPASFQAAFSTTWNQFHVKYLEFKQIEQGIEIIRDQKVQAENAVYKQLISMFKDGQKLFRHDAAIRELFTFRKVLQHVRLVRKESEPDIPSITGELNQVISQPDVNLGAKVNGKLFVNLNEGPVEEITGDGTSTVFINKQYSTQKIFKLLITGSITGLIELHLSDANLQDIKLHKDMKNIKELILQNNLLKTKTIDDILITVNKYGTSNGVLNLIGNEAPSAKGLAAKAELEARGWVVLVS